MKRKKLKQILATTIMTTFIASLGMVKVYAFSGLTAYIGQTYGNNITVQGRTIPNTAVTVKLIRTKDNNIRHTNETKSDKDGKFKFSINTQADEYKTLVSSTGQTVQRQLKVNDITNGIVWVRVEGKNGTLLNTTKVNVEIGHTNYYSAIIKALKDNNISYIEKDNTITQIGSENDDVHDCVCKVKNRKGQILSVNPTKEDTEKKDSKKEDLVKENDEIILIPGDLQKPIVTTLKVSPMDKDIINKGIIETTRGSSFIVKLEQLSVDMFGDSVSIPVEGQVIKFDNSTKITDKNGEAIFVANSEGTHNVTCETSMNHIHDNFIRPVPVSVLVKPKKSSGGCSGGGGGTSSTTVTDNKKVDENNKKYLSLRLLGNNRYETSKNICDEYMKSCKIDGVILALGNNFPDALSGSVLCNKYKMPIILAGNSLKNSTMAMSYIENNLSKDKTIYILGGTGGIKEDVEKYIKSKGYTNVKRLGGNNRFETNGKIVDEFNVKEGTPVIIASGENFPDALSISSVAGVKGYPILLVNNNNISDIIKNKLNQIKPSKIFIVGGIGSVSDKNVDMVKNITKLNNKDIIRIWGKDRYETSLAIAKYFNLEGDTITFANGQNFPDALSGSALSSLKNAPLILINNNDVSKQRTYVDNGKYIKEIFYGGNGVISRKIIEELSK